MSLCMGSQCDPVLRCELGHPIQIGFESFKVENVLDLERFESNLDRMAKFASEHGVALRPHAKTHKCVEIARRQIARGAIGISVETIAEAESSEERRVGKDGN